MVLFGCGEVRKPKEMAAPQDSSVIELTVAELDILDGTPLLDIKPYLPRFDCFETSESDSADHTESKRPSIPQPSKR